jgi:UDP-2,3-diacylglucosamine hydrolase
MQSLNITLSGSEKIYFASDFHLGTPDEVSSLEREKKIVAWLDNISFDAKAIFLLGDQFDFWFEYKYTIPKGFSRFIGKLAELRDKNIPIYFFTGNHDMWMFDYFPKELGIPIVRGNMLLEVSGKKLLIGHGDGLGPGDHKYKFLKMFFNSKVCQRLFAFLHPWIGFSIAVNWSKSSRITNIQKDEQFLGEKEHLWIFCEETEQKTHHDFYVFGHRHLVIDMPVGERSRYINLGEWVTGAQYAVFDGVDLRVKQA